jgi:tRNA A37 methylthiotransferase MiaB
MRKKVTIIELSLFKRMVPLVAGYLEAFSRTDSYLDNNFIFEKLSMTPDEGAAKLPGYLTRNPADIYAFSCYVWNTSLVRSMLRQLQAHQPQAYFLLGGPQVMRQAHQYLSPELENTAVCNGEGERTFADYLRALTESRPDLAAVKGLSFYQDNTLITTSDADRLQDLDSVPSPFLSGLFAGEYSATVLETNRGCPFKCGFCFWGAATNDRVYKFDEARIRDEMTWISKKSMQFMYIADANWGMLKRDVALTRHIAELKKTYDSPQMIYYSSAKNNPTQVTEITQILKDAELMITQPVSLQTTTTESLALIRRQNIKTSAYAAIQERVNELKISSYIELIWPLPGETRDSFQEGIGNLYTAGASTIIVYPHLLLHNTDLFNRQAEFGLVTRKADKEWGEAEVVIATSTVNEAEFRDGMRFFYSLHLLRNGRALYSLSNYLNAAGVRNYRQLIQDFAGFYKTVQNEPFAQFVENSIVTNEFYEFTNYGKCTHLILHQERSATNELLFRFVSSQSWWSDDQARCLFELDQVMKPYVYSTTPMDMPPASVCGLQITGDGERGYMVVVPKKFARLCREYVFKDAPEDAKSYWISHNRRQYPYMKMQTLEHNASACHAMILRIQEIVPEWLVVERDPSFLPEVEPKVLKVEAA